MRYDPDDPARGAAGSAASLWLVAAGLTGMAVMFVGLFGGVWLRGRRQRNDPSRSQPSRSQPSGRISAQQNPRVLVLVGVIFGVLGAAALVVGGVLGAGVVERASWPSTEATVTAVSRSRGTGSTSTLYQPRFAYDVGGREYTLILSYSTSQRFVVGEQRTVRYDPADPGDAVLDGAGTLISTVLLLVGLVTSSIVVTLVVRSRRPSSR